jgi:hypothetical protein
VRLVACKDSASYRLRRSNLALQKYDVEQWVLPEALGEEVRK